MKHTMFVLAIVVTAFVVGCQDNHITGPAPEGQAVVDRLSKNVPVRVIPINAILREPGQFHSFIQIVGQVSYTAEASQRDPVPPLPQSVLVLSLSLSAELSPFGTEKPLWSIAGSSHDELAISDSHDSPYRLQKTYKIESRNDGMLLEVSFEIGEKDVAVTEMSLQLPKVESQKDAN
jgi:hypothetical protein